MSFSFLFSGFNPELHHPRTRVQEQEYNKNKSTRRKMLLTSTQHLQGFRFVGAILYHNTIALYLLMLGRGGIPGCAWGLGAVSVDIGAPEEPGWPPSCTHQHSSRTSRTVQYSLHSPEFLLSFVSIIMCHVFARASSLRIILHCACTQYSTVLYCAPTHPSSCLARCLGGSPSLSGDIWALAAALPCSLLLRGLGRLLHSVGGGADVKYLPSGAPAAHVKHITCTLHCITVQYCTVQCT